MPAPIVDLSTFDRLFSAALASSVLAYLAIFMLNLLVPFYRLGFHPDYAQLVPPLLLNGIGTGLFTSPNNSAVMGAVATARIGTAAGMLATSRNLGMALGTAMAAAVIALRMLAHLAQHAGSTAATLASYQDGFLVAGVVALLAALTSVVRGSAATASTTPTTVEQRAIG